MRERLLGADHSDMLMMRFNYAVALRAAGKLDAAERELDAVYQARRRVLGDTHPETLRALGILGVIARDRKDLARAEVLLRQAAALHEKANGRTHPESIVMRNNYLSVLRDRGEAAGAAAGYAELLPLAEAVFPEDSVNIAVIRGNYGAALVLLRRYDEAEPLLLQSYRSVRAALPAGDPRLTTPRERVEQLYRAWGHAERIAAALADGKAQ